MTDDTESVLDEMIDNDVAVLRRLIGTYGTDTINAAVMEIALDSDPDDE